MAKRINEEIAGIIDNFIKENPEVVESILAKLNKNKKEKADPPITVKEWQITHPEMLKCASDTFYARLATDLLRKFEQYDFPAALPKGTLRTAAKSIAAYLEDLVTETGIWDAVRSLYGEKYGRKLPFYDVTSDYFDDDLNIEDIKLLIWQSFCSCGKIENRIFSPLSDAVEKMVSDAFDILVDRFDDAPAATRVADFIDAKMRSGDYFEVRFLALWLSTSHPLTAPPFARNHMREEAEKLLAGWEDHKIDLDKALYFIEAAYSWGNYVSMLGCNVGIILARMARNAGHDNLAENLDSVKKLEIDTYAVRPYNDELTEFYIPDGYSYLVRNSSFDHKIDTSAKNIASCMLIRFGEYYMVNGICIFGEGEIKPGINSQFPKIYQDLCREKIKAHRGRRVYFMKDTDEIGRFFDGKMRPQVMTDDDDDDPMSEVDNILMLLSDDNPPHLINDECEIFRDPSNPYYIARGGDAIGERALTFITQNILADDVIDYIADKKMLPAAAIYAAQGKRVGKAIVQDNLAFLMRFARVPAYRFSSDYDLSKPLIL